MLHLNCYFRVGFFRSTTSTKCIDTCVFMRFQCCTRNAVMRHICFVPITVTIVLLPSYLLVVPMFIVENVDVVWVQFGYGEKWWANWKASFSFSQSVWTLDNADVYECSHNLWMTYRGLKFTTRKSDYFFVVSDLWSFLIRIWVKPNANVALETQSLFVTKLRHR